MVAAALALAACSKSGDQAILGSLGSVCGRACLEAFAAAYLDALAAGDPGRLPLAADVVFVENGQVLELGQGTWRTVTGLGTYRHYFADVAAGQVGAIAVVEENRTKIIYDLRLAIADRRITEIETVAIRDPAGAARYEERGAPHPKFLESVPLERRLPRAELTALADRYLSGIERNDPNGDYSFFHDDCDRWEHARQTTNNDPEEYGHSSDSVFVTLGCRAQFETGFLGFVTRIRDRRYVVVDEERQTVFGFAVLDHNGTIRSIPLSDGRTFVVPSYFSTPRTLQVGEAWRIEDGKLRQVEMTLTELPYGARSPFGEGDASAGRSSPQAPAVQEPILCDRLCLESFVNVFLTALVRKERERLPGFDTLIYTENGQRLEVGDGLWGTATALGNYRLVAADPDSRTAVFVGAIAETDVRGVMFARLTLVGDRVGEIETFVVRHESGGERGGTLTLFAPRLTDPFDPADFLFVEPGLGLALDPQAVNDPRALAAAARELEIPGATVRERRTWVADVLRGLVVDLAVLDVANAAADSSDAATDSREPPASSTGPYSLMRATLYKIVAGNALSAKSATLPVPYGMGSGWE